MVTYLDVPVPLHKRKTGERIDGPMNGWRTGEVAALSIDSIYMTADIPEIIANIWTK